MKRYILHDPFNIYHFKARTWEHPVHKHTYFEVIFILKGRGKHHINGNTFHYAAHDVFLLGPEDYHSFEIKTMTEFCYIRFNESYSKINGLDKDKNWQVISRSLLRSSGPGKGSIVQEESEKRKLRQIVSVLMTEYQNRHELYYEMLRDSLMKAILLILARGLSRQGLPGAVLQSSTLENILHYLRENINNPGCLRIDHLANEFNYSPNYLSIFFKRHTGVSIKQYLVKYKLKQIEARLLYSNLDLGTISHEFGFSDESHLCKQFRKYVGVTPSAFRKGRGIRSD